MRGWPPGQMALLKKGSPTELQMSVSREPAEDGSDVTLMATLDHPS